MNDNIMKQKNRLAPTRTSVSTTLFRTLKKQKYLQIMAVLTVIWLFIFHYIPILGIQIAFKEYAFNKGIIHSPWVGLKQFYEIALDPNIIDIIINTLGISLIKTFLIFPIPVILAISFNEVRQKKVKNIFQTVSYFPYFISWSVVSLLASDWLSPSSGFVNDLLLFTGIIDKPYHFIGEPDAFWWVSFALEAWRNAGWGAIIYSAAIAGIDQELYEAAYMDGAGRFQRIFSITLPSILGTIMILFILNMGAMLGGGLYASNFQLSYLLGNEMNISKSEILDTYVLKVGIRFFRYSYAAAIGMITATVSMILLFSANFISKKITSEGFF